MFEGWTSGHNCCSACANAALEVNFYLPQSCKMSWNSYITYVPVKRLSDWENLLKAFRCLSDYSKDYHRNFRGVAVGAKNA